ncbi:hypothetical protein ZWY2020_056196 [Hordeum vulgare]|nr:hypothetical protein ZWY2020_056196 [Hordeum vulgare]
MGTYLSTPKTEKQSADGEGARVRYGLASMQGWRTTMEDAVSLPFPPPSPPSCSLCLHYAPPQSVYIVYTMIRDVCLYIVGKDEYDELLVIFAITSAVKDVCAKPPTERLFLDKYGRICLCLDEIVWQVVSELGAGAKSLLLSLEPPSSSDASGEYFFSDYGLGDPLASFPMHAYSRPQPSSCGNCILAIVPWKFLGLGLGLW